MKGKKDEAWLARRRRADAAIRFAERVARAGGTTGSVLFRPRQDADLRALGQKTAKSKGLASPPPTNRALELALRRALGLPEQKVGAPAKRASAPPKQSTSAKPSPAAAAPKPTKPKPKRTTMPVTKETLGGKKAAVAKVGMQKRHKKAAAQTTDRVGLARQKSTAAIQMRTAQSRRALEGARNNAASRLAFNAARRARDEQSLGESVEHFSFDDLRSRWLTTLKYLSFETLDHSAPDIVAAKQRLAEIEDEWQRRAGLERDDPQYFDWPSTDAPKGSGSLGPRDWHDIGVLAYLGYHVGKTSSLTARERITLLGRIFEARLPPLNSSSYMRQWDLPASASRLRKMAETVASLCRNAKRQPRDRMAEAVRHWEHDLSYLRDTYYVGRFHFGWPST